MGYVVLGRRTVFAGILRDVNISSFVIEQIRSAECVSNPPHQICSFT